ncbi:MAG: hypothetical protein ACOYXS_08685 [Chloroflexota bacterium]
MAAEREGVVMLGAKETKREAFVRLASKRTEAVIDRVRVLSNCANPYAYEYTDEDVRKIFSAIEKELRAARAKFQARDQKSFSLE